MQSGSNAAAGVHEGDVLAGKYRIERVLGIGGMGMVVAAHHVHLDEKVALKFLLPEALGDAVAVARFAREARSAVKIKSEHVARTLDVGTLENGTPYIVMEYLDGTDLAGWLRQRGPLPVDEALDFVLQAGEALAEAHALGIVHRDLKPGNLFCTRGVDGRPTIKVLDFGISKVIAASGSDSRLGLTRTDAFLGSPFYMSPEQMEATGAVDARTDIWALGVVLHELLTGHVPFKGETIAEVAIKIGTRAPTCLRAERPDAPEGLQAVILRCLEKDRERRYGNMAGLALALLAFAPRRAEASVEKIVAIMQAAGASATAPSISSLGTTGEPSASETMAPLGRTGRARTGKARLGFVAGIVILATICGLATVRRRGPGSAINGSMNAVSASAPLPPTPVIEGAVVLGAIPAMTAATSGATTAGRPLRPAPGLTPEPPRSPGSKGTASATPGAAAHPGGPLPTFAVPATAWTSAPKPDCDPAFTLDDQGEKHFKRECYR